VMGSCRTLAHMHIHHDHDMWSKVQGLEMFGDGFLEGTGMYGRSQVRKVRMDGM
jgi:glutamine cyclotransferase